MPNFSSSFTQNRDRILGLNSNNSNDLGVKSTPFTPQNSPQSQMPLPRTNANFSQSFMANRQRVLQAQPIQQPLQQQPTPQPTQQPVQPQNVFDTIKSGIQNVISKVIPPQIVQGASSIEKKITSFVADIAKTASPNQSVLSSSTKTGSITPNFGGPSRLGQSAQLTNTPQSRMQAKQAIDRMISTDNKIATLLPQTTQQMKQLNVDPLSLKSNPTKAFTDALNTVKNSYTDEWQKVAQLGSTLKNPNATTSQKIGKGLEAGVSQINFVLSPISAIFNGANQIPVLGTVSKLITLPFTAVGEGAADVSNKIVDKLPISQTAKNNIKPGIGEIFSLASQIALGKIGEVGAKKVSALEQRFGTEDAQTIIDKAQDLGAQSKAKNTTRTVLPPEHLQAEIARPEISNTPAAQILHNHAEQAKANGQHVAIDFNPKENNTNTITEKAPNGKPFSVQLVNPENKSLIPKKTSEQTIGEMQEATQSPDLTAYEKAINSNDMKTADALAAKYPGDARFQVHKSLGLSSEANPVTSRQIIKLDKTKYPGMQEGSVTVRPNGVASLNLHLVKEAQGQGQGTRAVSELEQIAQNKGANKVNISAFTEAKGFWEKQGYTEVPGAKTKSSLLVKMQKDLVSKENLNNNAEKALINTAKSFGQDAVIPNDKQLSDWTQNQILSGNKQVIEHLKKVEAAGKPISISSTIRNKNTETVKTENVVKTSEVPVEQTTTSNINKEKQNLTPIGEGETKTSKLSLGVEEKAVEAKLTKSLKDLPEYQQLNMKDQARDAVKFLEENPDKAVKIAMGEGTPPAHITPEAIFTAVENRALEHGDLGLIRQLAKSQLSTEATAMGQRIRTLGERNPDSPVSIMKDIIKTREKKIEKQTGTSVKTATEKTVKEIKAKVKAPDRYSWEKFIDSIAC